MRPLRRYIDRTYKNITTVLICSIEVAVFFQVDELHLIGEPGRGGTLETLLTTVIFAESKYFICYTQIQHVTG